MVLVEFHEITLVLLGVLYCSLHTQSKNCCQHSRPVHYLPSYTHYTFTSLPRWSFLNLIFYILNTVISRALLLYGTCSPPHGILLIHPAMGINGKVLLKHGTYHLAFHKPWFHTGQIAQGQLLFLPWFFQVYLHTSLGTPAPPSQALLWINLEQG